MKNQFSFLWVLPLAKLCLALLWSYSLISCAYLRKNCDPDLLKSKNSHKIYLQLCWQQKYSVRWERIGRNRKRKGRKSGKVKSIGQAGWKKEEEMQAKKWLRMERRKGYKMCHQYLIHYVTPIEWLAISDCCITCLKVICSNERVIRCWLLTSPFKMPTPQTTQLNLTAAHPILLFCSPSSKLIIQMLR